MKLKIAQVIGLNTDLKAAQVISSARNGDNSFFAVLDLDCDDAFTRGRQFLSELSDFYFDLEGLSNGEKLKSTYDEAQKKLATPDASGKISEFGLLLASVSGKVLYLIGKGAVEVYLKRAEKVSPLLSVGAPDQLISGFLQEDDKILLSTKSLISLLGEDLDKSLNIPLDNFEEDITDRIGTSDLQNQCLAALIVMIEEENINLPGLEDNNTLADTQQPAPGRSNSDLIPQETSFESKPNPLLAVKKILTDALSFTWQLKRFFPKSGRTKLIAAIVLIVIIAIGVGFKIKASKDAQKDVSFNQVLQESKDDFNTAKGLVTLNPAEAKSKLDNALNKVNTALSLKPDNSDAQNLKKQIEQDSGSVLQQYKVSDFPLFLDMDLVKKNFRAEQMSLSVNKLLLLDPTVKTLVVIDIAKKSNQILSGSAQLGDAIKSSLNGGLAFISSKDKGILKIDITNSKLSTVAKIDPDLKQIIDIYAFGGNVYLLDANGQIWKYLPTSDGYSDKRVYLTAGTKADFKDAIRMQIESSIYVLKKGGEILRFTKGEKDNFSIGGLDKGVKDPKSFFVSSDTDNLYLLDSGNSRLLVLTKTGAYKSQMSGDKFATATDLVVDETGKKVYLLEGGKIFQVDLK